MDAAILVFFTQYKQLADKAEYVFKLSQTESLDVTVLNEIRYANRALTSFLGLLGENPDIGMDDVRMQQYALDAQKGLAIAINDAIDTTVVLAKRYIVELKLAYPDASIAQAYGKEAYYALIESLQTVQDQVAQSREFREHRIERYVALAGSQDLRKIVQFLHTHEITENEMRLAQTTSSQSKSAHKTAWYALWVGIASALTGLFGLAPLWEWLRKW